MKKTLFTIAVALFLPISASAQEAKELGTFNDWAAFSYTEGNSPVCYIGSRPVKEEGKYTKRGDVAVLVTHRPSAGTKDVVSVIAGYTYKSGSKVTIGIGGRSFDLFTKDDNAWARDAATDSALVNAMIRGARMVVKGTSSRGTVTTDTYSLKGFTAAHKAAMKECGLS